MRTNFNLYERMIYIQYKCSSLPARIPGCAKNDVVLSRSGVLTTYTPLLLTLSSIGNLSLSTVPDEVFEFGSSLSAGILATSSYKNKFEINS